MEVLEVCNRADMAIEMCTENSCDIRRHSIPPETELPVGWNTGRGSRES